MDLRRRSGLPFTLTAKADRLDLSRDGAVTLIDYKTGTLPSAREVAAGFSPQLPLEGAIVRYGDFQGVASHDVGGLEYWRINGGGEGGERRELADPAALVEAAAEGLRVLVDHFDRPDAPYIPRAVEGRAPKYSDYLVLERLAEWAAAGEEEP
jgi:ATP-dependent helicase/nuclease subunit B